MSNGGGGGSGGGGSGSSTSKTKGSTSRSKNKPPVTQMTEGLLIMSAARQAVGMITFHLGGVPTTFEGIKAGYMALRESAGELFSTPGRHTGKQILARLQTECPYKVWSIPEASPLGYLATKLGALKMKNDTAAAIKDFERLCKLVKLTPLEERCLADALERIVGFSD